MLALEMISNYKILVFFKKKLDPNTMLYLLMSQEGKNDGTVAHKRNQ